MKSYFLLSNSVITSNELTHNELQFIHTCFLFIQISEAKQDTNISVSDSRL